MSLVHERGGAVALALLASVLISHGAVVPQAHYHLGGIAGIRDTVGPEVWKNRVAGGPDLVRTGDPKIMSNAPEQRRSDFDSAINFASPDQCYQASKAIAGGENFLVEVWVNAQHANAPGYHAVLANGHEGIGFLICQKEDDWAVLVGGVGVTALGKLKAGTWTHIAVAQEQGRAVAYLNGSKVAELPHIGSAAPNFSIGATAPGKESFTGWVAEVRCSTFKPGQFDPGSDLLLDNQQLKEVQKAELAARAKLVESLLKSAGVTRVARFEEQPAHTDWLINPPTTRSFVQILPGEKNQSAQIMVGNGLVSRKFLVADNNLGCVSLRRSDKNLEFLRAIKPEARISFNDQWVDIGGLTGAPDRAFITPEWLGMLKSRPGAFTLTGMSVGGCVKPYEWQPKCNAPADIAWPARGLRVTFHFVSPADGGLTVDVHYEIYDGIPVMMKTFTVHNRTVREIVVTRFEGEHLAVQPTISRMLHAESDYSFGAANFNEQGSALGIHVSGGDPKFKDYSFGAGTTRFVRDPEWGSMATLNPAEDLFLDNPESALLLSRPTVGPNWTVKPGEKFDAFRTFEILNDTTDRERFHLGQRRFYRKLAPQSNEKQLEVHAPVTRDLRTLGPLIDQMAEIGFEMLQAPEHPGGLNYADSSEKNINSMKAICDYARPKGIRVKAYQLMMASQGWGKPEDNYNCINPANGKPGSLFGQSACGASAWADMYYDNMWKTIEGAGMGGFAPDGPYHGDPCGATNHPHHKGLEDSQWAQWKWMCQVLHEGQRRNLYLSVPDWYVLNGQNCTGMGYREATDNIDIVLQTVIYRQYIFDATFHKTAQMGWCNLNTEVLRGGMEKNLDKYERMFFTLLSSGAQVWMRGHRLYDGPQSQAMLKKWMAWYRQHYDIIHGDIIHLRRPDGRDLDYYLHVNPAGKEKGMLLVFNPLDQEVKQTLDIPLYYTGLTETAKIREQEGAPKIFNLNREFTAKVPVTIPANGYTWLVVEP